MNKNFQDKYHLSVLLTKTYRPVIVDIHADIGWRGNEIGVLGNVLKRQTGHTLLSNIAAILNEL